jgi:hypothetical protein
VSDRDLPGGVLQQHDPATIEVGPKRGYCAHAIALPDGVEDGRVPIGQLLQVDEGI